MGPYCGPMREMDVTPGEAAKYVARMSDWTDDEEDGLVDIRFRGPEKLRIALDHLAEVQAEVKRLKGKKGKYSSNRLVNFIVSRWVDGWIKKFGPVPETKDAVRRAAEAQFKEEQRDRK